MGCGEGVGKGDMGVKWAQGHNLYGEKGKGESLPASISPDRKRVRVNVSDLLCSFQLELPRHLRIN